MSEIIDRKARREESKQVREAKKLSFRNTIVGFVAGAVAAGSLLIIGNRVNELNSNPDESLQDQRALQDQRVAGICHNLGANAMRDQLDPNSQEYYDRMCAQFSADFQLTLQNPSDAQRSVDPSEVSNISQ